MAVPCAVIGIGQTKYKSRRPDVTLEGLVREAVLTALDDAEVTFADIDAIVLGKAPDALEGVMMPELSLADAIGAVGKPIHRVHTAGSVGAATAISAVTLVESGRYERVLVVCYEKQSEGNATWALSGGRSGGQGAGGTFAPWIRNYIQRSNAPEHIGWMVAVKDRRTRSRTPTRTCSSRTSRSRRSKSRRCCGTRCTSSSRARRPTARPRSCLGGEAAKKAPRRPAWVIAHAKRTEFGQFPGRDTVKPQAGVDCARELYKKAGITDPRFMPGEDDRNKSGLLHQMVCCIPDGSYKEAVNQISHYCEMQKLSQPNWLSLQTNLTTFWKQMLLL